MKDLFMLLMQNHDFDTSVSQGTGDVKKVIYRFKAIKKVIEEVLQ